MRFTDPDGMGPFDELISRAKQAVNNYVRKVVVNTATTIVNNVVSNVKKYTNEKVNEIKKSALDIISPSPSSSSSSSRESGSGDGFSFVTDSREPSGDPTLVTNTSGNVTEVNVTGLEALTVLAGGKKASLGDGFTNAKNLFKKNAANAFADGVDAASDVDNTANALKAAKEAKQETKAQDSIPVQTWVKGKLVKEELKAKKDVE